MDLVYNYKGLSKKKNLCTNIFSMSYNSIEMSCQTELLNCFLQL